MLSEAIERVVSKLKDSYLELLKLNHEDLVHIGCPEAPLRPLRQMVRIGNSRDPTFFLNPQAFAQQTKKAMETRARVLEELSKPSTWAQHNLAEEQWSQKVLAERCAVAGQVRPALTLLLLSKLGHRRVTELCAAGKGNFVPGPAEYREVLQELIGSGLHEPWPVLLAQLSTHDAEVSQVLLEVLRAVPGQQHRTAAPGAHVLAFLDEYNMWAEAKVMERLEGGKLRIMSLASGLSKDLEPKKVLVPSVSGLGSLLRAASAEGAIDLVRCLLEIGVSALHEADTSASTSLHYAVRANTSANTSEVCRLLIQYGADKSLRNMQNEHPLGLALTRPHVRRVFEPSAADKWFVSVASSAMTIPLQLLSTCVYEFLKWLRENSIELSVVAPLTDQSSSKQASSTLQQARQASSRENSPLARQSSLLAESSNSITGQSSLPDVFAAEAVSARAQEQATGTILSLLEVEVGEESRLDMIKRCLQVASEEGHASALDIMLRTLRISQYNLSDLINAGDEDGLTPLMLAAQDNRARVVTVLVRHKCDLERSVSKEGGRAGHTALTLAARAGHVETCRLLLEAGASPHAKSKYGFNAFVAAAYSGAGGILELLKEYKFELREKGDFTDHNGYTAVHLACRSGFTDVVTQLLEEPWLLCRHTWNERTVDKEGHKSALMLAVDHGQVTAS